MNPVRPMCALLLLVGVAGSRPSNAWTTATIQVRKVPRDAGEPRQFIVDLVARGSNGAILQEPTLALLDDQEGTIFLGEFCEPKGWWSGLRPGRPIEGWQFAVRCRELTNGSVDLALEIRELRDGSVCSPTRFKRTLVDGEKAALDRDRK